MTATSKSAHPAPSVHSGSGRGCTRRNIIPKDSEIFTSLAKTSRKSPQKQNYGSYLQNMPERQGQHWELYHLRMCPEKRTSKHLYKLLSLYSLYTSTNNEVGWVGELILILKSAKPAKFWKIVFN